jgi:AbiV family abortive infection protein
VNKESENKEFLSLDQVKDGFQKCHKVINRLVSDAELALKNGRFSSAVSQAILAHEELGKSEYFRLRMGEKRGLTKKEWSELSFGGKSHLKKIKALMETKLKIIEESYSHGKPQSPAKAVSLHGFEVSSNADQEALYAYHLFEKILPTLNLVKQDCFYLNWDEKEMKWIYFENRFPEKIKKAIAIFIISQTKHSLYLQKYMLELPDKSFSEYSDEEWKKVKSSETHRKVTEARKYLLSTEYKELETLAFSAIESYIKPIKQK